MAELIQAKNNVILFPSNTIARKTTFTSKQPTKQLSKINKGDEEDNFLLVLEMLLEMKEQLDIIERKTTLKIKQENV